MKILSLFFFSVISSLCFSQDSIQISQDTSNHPYKKAALLSAIVPAAGQVFNSIKTTGRKNAYWKVPLIYAGLAGTGYLLVQNQTMVSSIKTEYNNRNNGGVLDPTWGDYDDLALVTLYQHYARLRDFSILGIGAVYAFQILDAAVEAHFLNFDVSEKLTLQVQPILLNSNTAGIHMKLSFH